MKLAITYCRQIERHIPIIGVAALAVADKYLAGEASEEELYEARRRAYATATLLGDTLHGDALRAVCCALLGDPDGAARYARLAIGATGPYAGFSLRQLREAQEAAAKEV